MNLNDAREIARIEDLHNINWYAKSNLRANQVGISKNNNEWIVYVTDERASIVPASIAKFSSEDGALDILIQKARFGKKYLL